MDIEVSGNKENEIRTPLSHLRIIVHPFFIADALQSDGLLPDYRIARSDLFQTLEEEYIPQSKDEATVIMPVATNIERDSLIEHAIGEEDKNSCELFPTWQQLFKTLQKNSPCTSNVLLVPDVQTGASPKTMVSRLETNMLQLTPATMVTVAGEWANSCVRFVSNEMLTLPEITMLRLDKNAVTGSTFFSGENNLREDIDAFRIRSEMNGFVVRENERYVYVSKLSS